MAYTNEMSLFATNKIIVSQYVVEDEAGHDIITHVISLYQSLPVTTLINQNNLCFI